MKLQLSEMCSLNRRSMGLALGAVLALAGLNPTAQAVNLVQNGGFETYDSGAANSGGTGYLTYLAGNAGISNWTVGPSGGSVDIVIPPQSSYIYAGNAALDLVGSPGPGSVEQTLATTNGATHTVTFRAQWRQDALNRTIDVSLGSETQQVVLGAAQATWELVTLNFTNVAGSSNVFKLASLTNNTTNGNTMIDEVSVVANPVPEPFTLALAAGALAAAARRRKR
ncbi:MAG: DUF642 domain-containing protein [Chthonomonadaceae bacterium]|nr:DUF642 domain-containing protein [Chthonomonadaceae bacterium]